MGLHAVIAKITKRQRGFDPDKILEHLALKILPKSDTLQEAFEISSREMEELYATAFAYYTKNEVKDAALVFRWLVVLNPFIVKYWKGYSASYQLLGQYERALHGYAIAALLEDSNPLFHFHAYECYLRLGDPEEAKKALLLAIERTTEESLIRKKFEELLTTLQVR